MTHLHVVTPGAPYLVARVALGKMKKNAASIVNIASVCSSINGFVNRAGYGAAKCRVTSMIKSVAIVCLADNIRCNAVCPGLVLLPSLQQRITTAGAILI